MTFVMRQEAQIKIHRKRLTMHDVEQQMDCEPRITSQDIGAFARSLDVDGVRAGLCAISPLVVSCLR